MNALAPRPIAHADVPLNAAVGAPATATSITMPRPPLALIDRIVSLEGSPGSHALGRIVTETEVTADAWYLQDGTMPMGIEIEAGQGDQLLYAHLCHDAASQDHLRRLGWELTCQSDRRPRVGDTLRYEVQITGHAQVGAVRLYLYQFDSYINGHARLSLRNGCAGFVGNHALDAASGIQWNPAQEPADASPAPLAHDAPAATIAARSFSAQQVQHFIQGQPYDCFGAGSEYTAAHTQPPRTPGGALQMFDTVDSFDPRGGAWGRGHLRAHRQAHGDARWLQGLAGTDTSLPTSLMLDGALQLMAFFLCASGHIDRCDAWTFEALPSHRSTAVCRGRVDPRTHTLQWDLFVRRLTGGAHPTVLADALLSVDGRTVFHGRELALRLWPDVPLKVAPPPSTPAPGARPPVAEPGLTYDQASLWHGANGMVSKSFGSRYLDFEGARALARLPAPPYHMVSRVVAVHGSRGELRMGSGVEVEYDIPPDAWYFADAASDMMPLALLMEAALQPCGWLCAYMDIPLRSAADLRFRNLDGDGTLYRPVYRSDGILRIAAHCTSFARNGDTMIEFFDISCHVGDELCYSLKASCGHFTDQALASQAGIASTAEQAIAIQPSPTASHVDLHAAARIDTAPQLSRGRLGMLDRLTGYWPQGGQAQRGRLLAEFDVNPRAWFFKAHFYRDPVQPGSLGVEGMLQLIRFHMRERGLASGFRKPVFEPVTVGLRHQWKYRGQVLPTSRKVVIEVEISDEGRDAQGPWVKANAWLWADGVRIYQANGLSLRVVEGAPA